MRLEQTFTVQAPIDVVWAALVDVERIAPCLPGAEISGQEPDGSYKGSFKVKLGPTTASYAGVLRMEEVDETARRAVMSAKGTDKRGQGGATATIVNTLREEGGATVVEVDTDYAITGKLARFGRSGMIEDISKRLLREFASCLEETLRGEPPAETTPAAPEAAAATGTQPGEPTADVVPPAPGLPDGSETAGVAATAPDAGAAAAAGAAATGAGTERTGAGTERTGAGTDPTGGAGASSPRPAPARPAPRPAKPISGLRLVLGALLDRLKRLVGGLLGRRR